MRAETSQPLRYGLVQLPQQAADDADVCVLCGLRHVPEPVANLAQAKADALTPAAMDLLRITLKAWSPLDQSRKHVPMPLAVRKKLATLREDLAKGAGHTYTNAENNEWYSLPNRWRMALLLLIGVDGDLGTLASRDFQRMPPPERAAVKSEVRLAKRLFGRMVALASLW